MESGGVLPIIQYWNSSTIPPYVRDLTLTFQRLNPEMPHRLFEWRTAEEFIASRFGSREAKAFRACAIPSMQSDYFRYCAVHALGGIYADVDYRCIKPLAPWLERLDSGELFLSPTLHTAGEREARRIWSGFFAFNRPRHPFLRMALDIATAHIEARLPERLWQTGENVIEGIWLTVGPGVPTFMRLLHDWGSFDAILETFSGTAVEPFVRLNCEVVGDYRRIESAFRGVSVAPHDAMLNWVRDPEIPLPYKSTDVHWKNAKGGIFKAGPPRAITSTIAHDWPLAPLPDGTEGRDVAPGAADDDERSIAAGRTAVPLFQYWHSEDVPDEVRISTATFSALNPDLTYRLFSEADAEEFIAQHLTARELAAFRSCAVPAMQADYFRYCATLALGGVYVDADLRCLRPLRPLIDTTSGGLLVRGEQGQIHNSFSVFDGPGHPLLRLALEIATRQIEQRVCEDVWWVTGPWIFTALYALHRKRSIEAARREARREFGSRVDVLMEATDKVQDLKRMFEAVQIVSLATATEWIAQPEAPQRYKRSETHWVNWQRRGKAIFRPWSD